MPLKQLFSAMMAVMFRYRNFWNRVRDGEFPEGVDLLRTYAVPVIAVVQLLKFPLIGVPRPAMLFSIASFLLDVTALYLLSGGVLKLLFPDEPAAMEGKVVTVLAYGLTPVWLFELFYFTPLWSWVVALLALGHTLLISWYGFSLLLGLSGRPMLRAGFFLAGVESVVFMLSMSLMRLFNF
ncbi:MAG: hypothetical protein RI826_05615 [Chlorobium phaeovibrioides]|nr:hypothetical protein [Chlorobium phaeovibrioides]